MINGFSENLGYGTGRNTNVCFVREAFMISFLYTYIYRERGGDYLRSMTKINSFLKERNNKVRVQSLIASESHFTTYE